LSLAVSVALELPSALRRSPALMSIVVFALILMFSPALTLSAPSRLTSAVRITIGESAVGAPSWSRPSSASAAP